MPKITLYFPEDMYAKLKEFGLPMSQVVQHIVKFYFEHRKDVDKKDDDKK